MRILVSLPAVVFVAPLALGPLPAHAHQSDPQPSIVIYCGEFGGVVSTPCRDQVQPAQGASPARPVTPRITAGSPPAPVAEHFTWPAYCDTLGILVSECPTPGAGGGPTGNSP